MGTTCCQNNQKHGYGLSEMNQLEDFITECQPKEQKKAVMNEGIDYEKKWRRMTLRARKKAVEVIGSRYFFI